MDDAFGLDPSSDEFQAVKREMERLARVHAAQVRQGREGGGGSRGKIISRHPLISSCIFILPSHFFLSRPTSSHPRAKQGPVDEDVVQAAALSLLACLLELL